MSAPKPNAEPFEPAYMEAARNVLEESGILPSPEECPPNCQTVCNDPDCQQRFVCPDNCVYLGCGMQDSMRRICMAFQRLGLSADEAVSSMQALGELLRKIGDEGKLNPGKRKFLKRYFNRGQRRRH